MHLYFTKQNTQDGVGIIEVVIGTSIIALSLVGVVAAFILHFQAGSENTKKIQATYLLEEGVEIARFLRDVSWVSNIAPLDSSTDYYLNFDGLSWQITSTPQPYIDGTFERKLTIGDVYRRNSDSDIVSATSTESKTIDTNIHLITVSVSWPLETGTVVATTTAKLEAYLANIF